jgi:threonine synthase
MFKTAHLSYLECSQCHKKYDIEIQQSFATCCNKPLLARYGLLTGYDREQLVNGPATMWRYFEMLPVLDKKNIVSLGEGMTPILELNRLRDRYEIPHLFLKDESLNPTGSFKARGMSAAVSKALEYGTEKCIVPTAGNAGGALAAYCASAGMQATVVMPRHTPVSFKNECELYGARLILVDGLISDCAKTVQKLKTTDNYFDLSTMKEPYRLEGKKTMGYEIAEQFDWELPDVILYPTGGGTGLLGMWKAFHEMSELGWIEGRFPKMIAVQAENCQPVVQTWKSLQPNCRDYTGSPSLANGLAVPNPFAEDMILQVLRESGGFPLAVKDEDMIAGVKEMARMEGLLVAPEGGALWTALLKLIETGLVRRDQKILILNTGSGYKYMENII